MSVMPDGEPGPRDVEAWTVLGSFRCFVSYISAREAAVLVKGDLDLTTAPVLTNELDAVLAAPVVHVAIDLSYLAFLDSSGLAALVTAKRRAIERGITLTLEAVPRQARIVLEASGLAQSLDHRPTWSDA